MENNRPKISSLSEKELAAILKECFFKVGKELKLQINETKIFLDEVYKKQGWMFVDTFSEVFSKYAACEMPEAEKLRPYISPLFIGRLMKLYQKQCNEKKLCTRLVKNPIYNLTSAEKYTLLVKHILANGSIPANPDWVCIYEHLSGLNKIELSTDWGSLGYSQKLKHARQAVTEWIYKNYEL